MYKNISPNLDFVEQEKEIAAFWEKEEIRVSNREQRVSRMYSTTDRRPQTASRISAMF